MRAHDLTVGLRNLSGRPLYAISAILLMGLAAGANAAVFSVVRGVLLKPLPYAEPASLVAIWPDSFVSNEDVGHWRDRVRSIEQIATASPGWLMALVAPGHEALHVTGARVSDNFFEMLGVRAERGRTLRRGESQPGRSGVVVLSADIFARHFGSDGRAIGRTIFLDGQPHEIVGVMPRGFEFVEPGTEVWAPLVFDPRSANHRSTLSLAFGRLREGVTPQGATNELARLAVSMRKELGKRDDWGRTLRAEPLQEVVTATFEPTLLIMLAAVGLILLLASVNLGTLVLSRSIERVKEIAIRAALGASRWHLVCQLLVEQGLLALAGALGGLVLARVALPVLLARMPPEIPRQPEISLDTAVFVTVLGASVCVALLCAVLPILLVARPQLQALLRQHHTTETPGRKRALDGLVALQMALAVVLGIGAGLMLRSLWKLQMVDPGFDPRSVLTFRLQTTSTHRALATGLPYFERVVKRVGGVPGVRTVGSIQHLPMTGYNWTTQVYPVERPPTPGVTPPSAVWRFIGWDYFRTLGIPLRAGRLFTHHDTEATTPVSIVNETFARKHFGSARGAVGRRLVNVTGRGTREVEVIGVTGDVRYMSLDATPGAEIYRPLAQTFMFPMAFVVKVEGDPAQIGRAIRRAMYEIDPTIPVAEMQPLETLLSRSLGRVRLLTLLMSVFAGAGLLLAVVGVHGVVAYGVRRREREFGIRLALGALPAQVAAGVLRQGALYAIVGIAAALPVAFVLTQLMRKVIYGVSAHDATTFAALPLIVLAVAIAAAYVPARRAAGVDPAQTMRAE